MIDEQVVGHNGRCRRPQGTAWIEGVAVHPDVAGYTVGWPHRPRGPVRPCGFGAEALVQGGHGIDSAGRRGQAQADDAAAVPVHRHCQIQADVLQGLGIHGVDVQAGGVHQDVLPRPSRQQLAVHALWSPGDVTCVLGRTGKQRRQLLFLFKYSASSPLRGQTNAAGSVPGDKPCVGVRDDQRLRGLRSKRELCFHFPCGLHPSRVLPAP